MKKKKVLLVVGLEYFVYANNAEVTSMFSSSPANKPTHESWNGKL